MEETWGGRLVVHERGSKSSAGEEAEEGDAEGSLRKGVGEGGGGRRVEAGERQRRELREDRTVPDREGAIEEGERCRGARRG